jgi:hypothetical protein
MHELQEARKITPPQSSSPISSHSFSEAVTALTSCISTSRVSEYVSAISTTPTSSENTVQVPHVGVDLNSSSIAKAEFDGVDEAKLLLLQTPIKVNTNKIGVFKNSHF